MTKIVGIDFGTVNVRIAQWDVTNDDRPSICKIGSTQLAENQMPAVIAFRMNPDGTDVETLIGEEADVLDDADNIVVVRNIKKYATSSDEVVRAVMEWDYDRLGKSWPKWMNPDDRSIRVWNKALPAEEAMKLILKEAISRAGLAGEAAEWRAGCPVSSDLAYRKALVAALDELGCEGKVGWVAEEPLLLLSLGKELGSISEKTSYMVYDMGGGSFDCSIAQIDGGRMAVYGQEGLPEGGMEIDDELIKRLDYKGSTHELRIAKERLSPETPEIELSGDSVLKLDDVNEVMRDFFTQTLMAMLSAYSKAKVIWKRPDGISEDSDYIDIGGGQRAIKNMVCDIDKVLVVGGPTRAHYISGMLNEIFGAGKIMTAADLVQAANRTDITDAAITALAHGACYMRDSDSAHSYPRVTVERVPATITLTVTSGDGREYKEDTYVAFHRPIYHYRNQSLAVPYVGDWVNLESKGNSSFQVLVIDVDGEVIMDTRNPSPDTGEFPIKVIPMRTRLQDGYLGPLADRARLVIERLGSIWVELGAGREDVVNPLVETKIVLRNPPWQTGLQEEVRKKLEEIRRQREEAAKAAALVNWNLPPGQRGNP